MQISVAEARARTRALLGLDEAAEVAWVTEAYLQEDAEGLPAAPPDHLPRRLYGIGLAWGWRPGVGPTFEFSAGAGNGRWPVTPDQAVGGLRWWAPQNGWRLVCEGCPDGPAFRRVGRIEWWG